MDKPLPCTLCTLRPLPGFKPAREGELAFIARRKVGQLRVRAGAGVISEGGADDRIYTLLAGWAFRYKSLPDGRRQILNILLPGDIIGLQAELLDAMAHGVEALTDVSLCVFARDMVWSVFRVHPALALDLTWLAAHEERLVDDAILSIGRRTALERVAALLVHLYKRAVASGLLDGGSVPFPLTQAHIADTLGLSVVHTNRTLQRLRRAGLADTAGGRLVLGDLRGLRRVAQYWEQPAPPRPLF
ncbi:Crp/Fnr family transcriptional regulator [Elioraea sp.]|uniref:Crp/Fnr family transcriptional regulator n=1 Tax=Elioraea sp. TaxID=2185103 RepID=UPI0025C41D76|nr:Crp/Fnr family transcriptional regulator [Elioraea sp.]